LRGDPYLNAKMEVRIMKRPIIALVGTALAVAGGLVAGCGSGAQTATPSAPKTAKLLITHVTRGCHDWSVNGGSPAPSQTVSLRRGGSLTVTNKDVMPHTLVQIKGPAAAGATAPQMTHMGAQAKISFARAGVYHFTTKAGEDYPYASGVKTVGADHTLQLEVTVTS
jgi:hypothetical protein